MRKRKKIVIGILCFPIIYVLSIGPVAKLEDTGIVGEGADKILHGFYAPLISLGVIPGIRPFMNWYIFQVWKCDTMGDNTI